MTKEYPDRANCAFCQHLLNPGAIKNPHRGYYACKRQLGPIKKLDSLQPSAKVSRFMGFTISLTVLDAAGKEFSCNFLPRRGFTTKLR